jgi:hypothetical protein
MNDFLAELKRRKVVRAAFVCATAAPPWVMPDGERLVLVRGGNLYSDLLIIEGALRGGRHD